MHRPLLLALTAVVFPVFALSGVGHARRSPGQICTGTKLKATGKAVSASVGCHARAAKQGGGIDPACPVKAAARLADAFARAEARGGCVTVGDADDIDVLLDSSVAAFVAALRPATTRSRCAAAKLAATGKKVKTKLGCQARAAGRGPACLTQAEAHFAAAFAKAERRPPCLTTGDAADVEELVDDLVDDVVVALPPAATTTTTSTTTTSTTLGIACGDAAAPACGGDCPAPDVCQAGASIRGGVVTRFCGCIAPTAMCGSISSDCDFGVCQAGKSCTANFDLFLCGCQ